MVIENYHQEEIFEGGEIAREEDQMLPMMENGNPADGA